MFELSNFIIIGIAIYGISVTLAEYSGPFNVLEWLRIYTPLPDCAVCISWWVGAIAGIATKSGIIVTISAIGLSIILARKL